MREHIHEHVVKYFPEAEPVVLEEIVVPEEEPKFEEEEDGKTNNVTLNGKKCIQILDTD